jgi:RNA polymerase sigma-70 factor (ECF subfamily)
MSALLDEACTADDALERAQRGDHDAFAEIISAHQSMVFGIAWHFFGDRDRAEEIAQDVFLQLYRHLGTVTSRAHLLFWLRQVTARRCIDETRRAEPRKISLEDVDLTAAQRGSDPFLSRRLRALVAQLPERQRIIVTLRYQEDLDPADICRIIGMPVNTVKNYLHRAIVALRKKLGESS